MALVVAVEVDILALGLILVIAVVNTVTVDGIATIVVKDGKIISRARSAHTKAATVNRNLEAVKEQRLCDHPLNHQAQKYQLRDLVPPSRNSAPRNPK